MHLPGAGAAAVPPARLITVTTRVVSTSAWGPRTVRALSLQGTEQDCELDKATCHLQGEPPGASLSLPTCEMGLCGHPRGHSENECDPRHDSKLVKCFVSSGKFLDQLLGHRSGGLRSCPALHTCFLVTLHKAV